MKKIHLLLILILLSVSVYSATKSINLEKDESIIIEGRSITLRSVSYSKLMIELDGTERVYSVDTTEENDGVEVAVGLIYDPNKWRNLSVDLNITVNYVCGDGKCEAGETRMNCCKDCDCSKFYSCYKNKCIKSDLIGCFSDLDCDDNNPCTIDSCGGSPVVKCRNVAVTECRNNDSCCPLDCFYGKDNDCAAKATIETKYTGKECREDSDCNDDNETTIDECNDMTNFCFYYPEQKKEKNITLIESNVEERPCRSDSDCNDSNKSTVDRCDGIGNICYYVPLREANMITGNAVAETEPEKKEGIFKRFFDWLLGFF